MPAKRSSAKSDGSLARYNAMRNFSQTPEPAGALARKPARAPRFVVQMHRATRLHYDFRLDGVLKSWAIPKGPSLDPHDKRLAMHVEDHPLDYRDFEGIIPAKNYGAGEVVVWDRGTYRLLEGTSTTEQIAKGSLKFELRGKKLRGAFALVHIKGRGDEENAWLLIKERDDEVDTSWKIEKHPESVKSGKTLADIARDPRAPHWQSSRPSAGAKAHAARKPTGEPLPTNVQPMLASLVAQPFDDPRWLFELKWDGYRAIVIIDRDGTLHVVSRKGNDFLAKFPELKTLPEAFSERPLIIDGEIVVLDDQGRPSFQALQERLDRFGRRGVVKEPITLVVFDLLYGNGRDLRGEPLEQRKAVLEGLLTGEGAVMFSKHVIGDGKKLFALAQAKGLEGIIAKRRDSLYVGARSNDWRKIKTHRRQEIVVGGWTQARGSRSHFGALLAGVYEGEHLVYVGSVGTGFDRELLASIGKRLERLERKTSPFSSEPKTESPAHWVTPELVAEVHFSEWTRDGRMRQPVFIALRADKHPRDVTREREIE
jgi:bifunctional non-homologous end joining protein LigD